MRPLLGRVLFLCAMLRGGWWAWTCLGQRWWAELDQFAGRMAQKGWAAALGAAPDAHAELLARCLLRPQCAEVLQRRVERLTLQVEPLEWLSLGLAAALMVVGLLLTVERSSALPDSPPGQQLRKAVRRK